MVVQNNLTRNLTEFTSCFFVINLTGDTTRICCDFCDSRPGSFF